jgi:hypothetical protein
MTYGSLLEGAPSALWNREIIDRVLKEAQRLQIDSRVWLVDPPRRDYFQEPGDMKDVAQQNWIPEWLPLVQCIGIFTSSGPARDKSKHFSTLTIVWFQDEYAPPILEPAISAIRAVEWNSLAADFED